MLLYLLKVMNVFPLSALREHVVVYVDAAAVADFGQFGFNVKHKGSKFTNVDRATLIELLGQVGDEGTPDDEHL